MRHSHVLARSSAVVCHAGFNTLMAGFAHGVPAVCLPLDAGQPGNARCVETAGVGIGLANAPARDPRGPLSSPDRSIQTRFAHAIAGTR